MIPIWFSGAAYLSANPDVAADPYYGQNPWKHFKSTGYIERRTWKGDPRGGEIVIQPTEPEPEPDPTFDVLVPEIQGQSFMSMERLSNGQILVGTYSFPASDSYIYAVGYADPIAKLDVGESVFRIVEDNGYVYVACEYEEIWRSPISDSLSGYDFKFYKKLKAGKQHGAFDVKRLLGQLVFVGGGEIYVDGSGTVKEWGKEDYYVKFAFQCQNTAFVGGYSYKNKCAGWLDSWDAQTWAWKTIGPKYSRFMQAAVSIDQQYIYLVGTNNYRDEHNHNAATLWLYDTLTGSLAPLWNFPGFDYSSCIKITEDGRIFLGLTKGWRSQEPGASLVEWDGKKPHVVDKSDYAELRELAFKDKKIYYTLRTDRVGGAVCEISGVI
ncbi:hypothetical protein LCGC14_1619190 [marine sediment metagenome]|uniref:Uncharacterized protein n=1 Tax=marine sediment metagenome TaxID=412755 RepID=A0A0F9L606_9ZZZZ